MKMESHTSSGNSLAHSPFLIRNSAAPKTLKHFSRNCMLQLESPESSCPSELDSFCSNIVSSVLSASITLSHSSGSVIFSFVASPECGLFPGLGLVKHSLDSSFVLSPAQKQVLTCPALPILRRPLREGLVKGLGHFVFLEYKKQFIGGEREVGSTVDLSCRA